MAESSRQVELLTRQHNEAQSRVEQVEQEVNLSELTKEMDKIK